MEFRGGIIMSGSVFTVMEKRGLTTLEIFQNRKEGKFLLRGAKEWDDKLDFSRYATDFNYVDILTGDYNAVGTETLAADFNELGLKDYLEQIKQLLREGRHEGIEFYYHRRKNIRIAFCKHSVTVGIKNRRHAIRTGAMRRHNLDDPEIDVLTDGLNLAGAMAYKNAIAHIPYGGCKTLVQCNPVKLDDFEKMGFLSYVADRCRCFPGADMGLDEEMVDIIREKYTKNFVGGTRSPLASTGTPTAYGEFVAIKEACDFVYGSRDLSGRSIAVQGLGHVGYPLAEYLLGDGAKLIVTDIDLSRVHKLQQQYGSDSVKYVTLDEIYTTDADVFTPCAMGGIITEDRIPLFKFRIIIGSANNQLMAASKEAELELAKKLEDAGILFVVAWAHNTGGVISAALLWLLQEDATEEQLKPKIELVCRDNFRKLLEEARETGKPPTVLVYEKVEAMIYSE
jgi:glutamate dehydrogenase/leucine dehydrogenase